jgi:hypothetical protein
VIYYLRLDDLLANHNRSHPESGDEDDEQESQKAPSLPNGQ